MVNLSVKFVFERETKGAVRFQEVDDNGNHLSTSTGATIGTLYLRKDKLGGVMPTTLEVAIKADVKAKG